MTHQFSNGADKNTHANSSFPVVIQYRREIRYCLILPPTTVQNVHKCSWPQLVLSYYFVINPAVRVMAYRPLCLQITNFSGSFICSVSKLEQPITEPTFQLSELLHCTALMISWDRRGHLRGHLKGRYCVPEHC